MDFEECIVERYSVRKYKNQEVSKETLMSLVEVARLAPSAVNYQPWQFVVITTAEQKAKMVESYPREWFALAPAIIVVCADHSQSWKRKADGKDYADIDVAIAIDHLTLAATNMGLGSCWVCNFDVSMVKDALCMPDKLEPIALIPVGYPSEDEVHQKKRKELNDVLKWERF